MKNNKAVTLVALIITVIILLILAGVVIAMTTGNDGIINKSQQAVEEWKKSGAREKLELVLGEVQMSKFGERLSGENYENRLDSKIQEIGELLDKDTTNPNYQQVVVEGYIFLVDRSVPRVIEYVGPAGEIVITANITGDKGWLKQGETINVTVTGTIKTYTGGKLTEVSATKGGTAIAGFSIDAEGKYTINNITEDTTIVINAKDSNNKECTKTIPITITIEIDNTKPVVDKINTRAEKMNIIINAKGHDNESGIKEFKYTITSTTDVLLQGIPTNKRTGTFTPENTVEITATEFGIYKVSIKAIDNAGNESESSIEKSVTLRKIFLGVNSEMEISQFTKLTGELIYESTSENVLKVLNDGKIKGISEGESVLKVKSSSDPLDYESFWFVVADNVSISDLEWRHFMNGTFSTHPLTFGIGGIWQVSSAYSLHVVCIPRS